MKALIASCVTPEPPSKSFASQLGQSRDHDILTVHDVACELRCSKAHVYKVINGEVAGVSPLPAISMGCRRLVRRSTLEEWKRMNERAAADAMMIPSQNIHAVDA